MASVVPDLGKPRRRRVARPLGRCGPKVGEGKREGGMARVAGPAASPGREGGGDRGGRTSGPKERKGEKDPVYSFPILISFFFFQTRVLNDFEFEFEDGFQTGVYHHIFSKQTTLQARSLM